MYTKGAMAVPWVKTIKKPKIAKTSKIGISQYFFLSFINKNSSFKNSIKTDYLN